MKSMKWWMENYKKSKSGAVLAVLILLFVITSGCSIFPKEAVEEEIPVIEPPKISKKPEMVISRGDIEITAKGSGQVFSNTEEYLYFTGSDEKDPTSGAQNETFRIRKVYVEQGDQVKAGQVLAELETRDLDLQIEKGENKLKIEEYRLIQKLREEANTEEEQIDIEQAKAAFRDMQIEHQKLVRQMQNSQVIAPFDGQVSTLYYSSGDQVKAYDPVLLLVNPSDLVVGIRITENEQKMLTLGQEVKVEIKGEAFKGKIAKMPSGKKEENNRDPWGGNRNNKPKDEREGMVLVSVDKLPAEVKRGTPANGTIVLQKKANVVKIPLSFLHTYGDRNYVIVTDAQGKREVDVELGLRSAREVEIVEGVDAGVTIIGR